MASQEAVFICGNPVICHKHIYRVPKIANTVGNNKEVVIIDAPILQNGAGRDAQREKLVTQEAPPATSTPQASRKGLSTEGAYTVKLTNLSIAILIALGTVACGGSDNNSGNNNPPADPPAPQPKPETPPADNSQKDSKIVDPTETHVVDGRDLSKDSTIGGLQYIRRESSDYDRVYNPDKMASATPLLGVSLNEQNPKLTNIVLARRDLEREENKGVRAQFAGSEENEPLTHAGKEREQPSLQIENFKNVDILAGAFKQVGSAVFADPSNRLDPVTHNIDTHIQNNTDKSGEFTRDRVAHVYTLRYEYQQPYVDYPHAKNASDIYAANTDPKRPETSNPDQPPLPPAYPNSFEEMGRLIVRDGLSGSDYNWLNNIQPGTENADANSVHSYNRMNRVSRHIPNIGILDPSEGLSADSQVTNDIDKYGNLTGAAGTHAAARWRNKTGEPYQDWTGDGLAAQYASSYPNGAYPRYVSIHPRYQNWRKQKNDTDHNPGDPWYIAGQPRYPNERYNPATRYTDDEEQANTPIGAEKTHRHTYLEREDFTAVREIEPIRPLKNPVPNNWKWDLTREVWSYVINYDVWRRTWHTVTRTRPDGTTYTEQVPEDTHVGNYDEPVAPAIRKYTIDGGCTPRGNSPKSSCSTHSWTLYSAEWTNPQNLGGGIRGEFRGPAYVGWHEDPRTIRFADERIWKVGAPGYKPEYEKKYGANLIWWSTQDSAFENWATLEGWNPRARRVDNNMPKTGGAADSGDGTEDLVWGTTAGTGDKARDHDLEIQPTGDITNGLIRIGGTSRTGGKLPTLGQELSWEDGRWKDHHNTTSRIFGHYHLAYADQDDRKVKSMSMNSYSGARSFVAKVKDVLPQATAQGYRADLDSAPVEYSIGAQPITLHKVQYGRVTTQLDLAAGEGPFGDGFLRAPFAKKNTDDSVDNYFFRGIDATSVADMPKEGSATYNGHALMYGINNDFHGVTQDVSLNGGYKNLPNAFDGLNGRGQAQIALGNFVEANVDFATRKVKGDVYNAWLTDLSKSTVVHDKLVAFEGNIIGNTVLGKADRSYIHGNDEAEFRAAFFGKEAEEMGGAFNSVKPDDKYGSAYENGDWGGVFGAVKSASNTFQGDDGKGVYGNSNVAPANNYNE